MEELADGLYSKTDKQDIRTKKLREVKGQKMPMNMEKNETQERNISRFVLLIELVNTG